MSKTTAMFMDWQANVIAEWLGDNPGKDEEAAVDALFPDMERDVEEYEVACQIWEQTGFHRSAILQIIRIYERIKNVKRH